MAITLAFVYGTIFGSFLNVLLWRLPEGKGVGGRSHCRVCHATLAWYDLVPLVSYVVLRGRCRHCHTRIHIRYPLVELTGGLVLALYIAINPFNGLSGVIDIASLLVLVSLFFFDLLYFILPDVILVPAIIGAILYEFLAGRALVPTLISAFLMVAFFAILYMVTAGKSLGFGDVKLAALIGFLFPYPMSLLVLVGGIWLGAAIAIALLIARVAHRRTALPFGSFLTAAAIAGIIFQHEIIALSPYFR